MIEIDFTIKPKEIMPEYVIDKRGNKRLYDENGLRHSYNGLPAVIMKDGSSHWYKHGERHRDNDLPAYVCETGHVQYWVDGNFIRMEGP